MIYLNPMDRVKEVKNNVILKPLDSFETKDELEDYGKEYGIDLKKNKSLANMYKDLVSFVK